MSEQKRNYCHHPSQKNSLQRTTHFQRFHWLQSLQCQIFGRPKLVTLYRATRAIPTLNPRSICILCSSWRIMVHIFWSKRKRGDIIFIFIPLITEFVKDTNSCSSENDAFRVKSTTVWNPWADKTREVARLSSHAWESHCCFLWVSH